MPACLNCGTEVTCLKDGKVCWDHTYCKDKSSFNSLKLYKANDPDDKKVIDALISIIEHYFEN